ncbi:MAG: aspartate carbamoyltransferase regulatory subunit [Bacteroidales bacterium]|nr:aspartate carbamoyltransferase regulatory subunit [Bacteroidales bacterium]MBQ9312046.1 aspartate carbamoyltransferase regulatory subunit [Bacteroidales bacterium]
MTTNNKELIVKKIENGTVIDHIPADKVFDVVRILGLISLEDEVLIGTNLESKKYGRKGIIKATNKFFDCEEIDKLAIIAPTATLITIKNYEVVEKKSLSIPKEIHKIVKCINPNCVTNVEEIDTQFNVVSEEPLTIQCHYCEKTMTNINFK